MSTTANAFTAARSTIEASELHAASHHEDFLFEMEALKKENARKFEMSMKASTKMPRRLGSFDDGLGSNHESSLHEVQISPKSDTHGRSFSSRVLGSLHSLFPSRKRNSKVRPIKLTPKNIAFFKEYITRQESVLRNDNNSLFYWVALGDLAALQSRLSMAESNTLLKEVDPTGANIILKAYMCQFYEMGRWLVETYPYLALEPYSDNLPNELRKMGYPKSLMPFTGLNILHLVIVRREFEEIRWLLDFYKDHKDSVPNGLARLFLSNIVGYAFDHRGDYYFGGLPLHFAVCSNSIEIFDIVLSYSSSLETDIVITDGVESNVVDNMKTLATLGTNVIFMRDKVGNTVLHLCAIHGLDAMFEHVYKTAESIIMRELKVLYSKYAADDVHRVKLYDLSDVERLTRSSAGYSLRPKKIRLPAPEKYFEWLRVETKIKLDERLLVTLNTDMHSPLTLAASIRREKGTNRENTFKSLIASQKKVLWSYGPIKCSEISLDGIETKYNLDKFEPNPKNSVVLGQFHSAITWLCLSESEDCIVLPEIKDLIEAKWKLFGLPLFILESVSDVSITVSLTLQLMYIHFGPTLEPHTSFDWFIDILYAITFIVFLNMLFTEIKLLRRTGYDYLSVYGAARFHVMCRLVKLFSFPVFFAFQLLRHHVDHHHTSEDDHAIDDHAVASSSAELNYSQLLVSHYHMDENEMIAKIAMTASSITAWVHIYYYLIGFEKTGPFLLVLSRIVIRDIPYFLQFFIFILLGLACTMSMVANNGSEIAVDGIWRFCEFIFGLVQKTVNLLPPGTYPAGLISQHYVDPGLVWMQDILITFFYGIVVFVLLNMLIAIMTQTYLTYASFNEAYFLIEKYHIMKYFEMHMSEKELLHQKHAYCTKKIHHVENEAAEIASESTSNSRQLEITYAFELREVMQEWLDVPPPLTLEDMKKFKKTTLLIVDPQCDYHANGVVRVPGADEASRRVAGMILKHKQFIHEIFVTMDTRFCNHISHPLYWRNKYGKNPKPYTIITYNDVKTGVWIPTDTHESVIEWCLSYTKELERKDRSKLMIWPEHCILGSRGHTVVPCINNALQEWASYSKRPVNYIMRGQNCRTEMCSALEAEVADPLDFASSMNSDLLSQLRVADRVTYIIITTMTWNHIAF